MTSKFFALLLALTVPLSLVGCSGDETTTENTAPSETSGDPTAPDRVTDSTTPPSSVEDWVTYESSDGRYEIKFPQEPLEQNQTAVVSENQQIELSLAIYESQGRAYMSGANPIPLPEGASFDVEQGLDGGRDNAAASTNSEIESEDTINIEGLPARSIVMRNPDGVRFKLMMIADAEEAVLYQLLVGAEDGNIDFPEANTFFESFKITRS